MSAARLDVVPVNRADHHGLAGVYARAFHDDPVWTWVFPDPTVRAKRLPPLFRRWFRHAERRHDTVRTTVTRQGAAIWRPPGRWGETRWTGLRMAVAMAPLFRDAVDRITVLGATVESHHPTELHWYLATLGTDPSMQGRGVGSALLAEGLARCDADGLPAYLDTETEANVAFYARHGFVVRDEADVPRSGPHMWFLWRDPRGPAE